MFRCAGVDSCTTLSVSSSAAAGGILPRRNLLGLCERCGTALGATGLAAGGVVQDVHVHGLSRQLHVAHHAASDEAVAHALHVWKARLVHHVRVLELDVQVLADQTPGSAPARAACRGRGERAHLVDRVQCAYDGQVVLQLNRDLLAHQRLEEAREQHGACTRSSALEGGVRCGLYRLIPLVRARAFSRVRCLVGASSLERSIVMNEHATQLHARARRADAK